MAPREFETREKEARGPDLRHGQEEFRRSDFRHEPGELRGRYLRHGPREFRRSERRHVKERRITYEQACLHP